MYMLLRYVDDFLSGQGVKPRPNEIQIILVTLVSVDRNEALTNRSEAQPKRSAIEMISYPRPI